MQKTNIEYLDYIWNPIAMRCTPISAGCENCWHLTMCDRLKNNPKIPSEQREIYAGDRPPKLIESRLEDPLKLKTPAIIGVQFMGDLFYEDIRSNYIGDVFRIMSFAKQHTFIILTKRIKWANHYYSIIYPEIAESNIFLGVSVEDQTTADKRISILLQISAALHFVSYEPALGPVDFNFKIEKIDWLIAGCELGSNRRPAHVDWFRSARYQCVEAGIPFFMKQRSVFGKIIKLPYLDGQRWGQMPGNRLTKIEVNG